METAIRATRRVGEANEWALALTALRIPHRIEMDGDEWIVLVPDAAVRGAARPSGPTTRRRGAEHRTRLPPRLRRAAPPGSPGSAPGPCSSFFFVTGPPAASSSWSVRGAAVSGSMLNGEPWRAVTALTLHVDLLHVMGNVIATALLLPPIIRRLGPGIGLALALLSGAGGNLLAAWVQGPRHVAVGASTATFGALGILAALRLASPSTAGRARGRRWIVPVASLLLLAMLGTGPGTDVIAHALGLVAGAVLGLGAALVQRPVAAPVQRVLVAAVALAVLDAGAPPSPARPDKREPAPFPAPPISQQNVEEVAGCSKRSRCEAAPDSRTRDVVALR